jgi:multidrug efflux pump subunit AcrA (membrane-fusion protein)
MKKIIKKTGSFIARRPLISFLSALVLLFVIVFISGYVRTAEDVSNGITIGKKTVRVMRASDGAYAQLSGQVKKDGETTIIAQVSGIVHDIYVTDGQQITRGQRLVYVSDTYSGGSRAGVAYKIADRQAQLQDTTFEKNMSIIDDQRDDVNKTGSITSEIARKQYTIQKRNTEANYDITRLQQQQAGITAALHVPTAPFAGVVDHVFVSRGDIVNPGDHIAVVNATEQTITLVVHLSAELADVIRVDQPSKVKIGDEWIDVLPRHLSRGPAQDQSFIITYEIDARYRDSVINDAFVDVSIPVETHNGEQWTLLPLDAVRLMSDGAMIFVANGENAQAISVETGRIVGGMIYVRADIDPEAQIIVDRTVFDGDTIVIK